MMTTPEQKPSRRNVLLDQLSASFAVFRDCQPLALGIHKALREKLPEVDQAQVRHALRAHTASTRYLKALAHGENRYDLDGNVAGAVSPEEREHAANELKERFRKNTERRRAEQQAQKREENLKKLAEKFNSR